MHHRLRKAAILLIASICLFYLLYRGLFTLNLTTWYATSASLLLYVAEMYGVVVVLLFFLQVWDTREPPQQPVLMGRTVDVFVPTYNEDPDLLRTTLQACVRMDYPHHTFLCDDGGTEARCNDPEKGPPSLERQAKLLAICEELGVTYVTRPDNRHAKAGNLNYAFEKTNGEFIIIFDADHVPEPQFITRLIGYFADEKLAFVQTPHAFYNFESFQSVYDHQKGLYWEDGQLFYKVIQPGRNRWNAAIFAGSAALFRREALAEVGYIATETITEDMHTGLRMHSKGWKSMGISQRLIAGQAAPDVTTFHTQRLRWGEGNLSIMAHDNPLNTRGLKLGQRLCYLGSMIHWAGGVFKAAIYFTPLMMLISGVPPVNQFTWTLFVIMVLYVLASVYGVKYVSNGHGSFWRNEMFTMLGFWTQIQGTMRALFMRKLSKFVVTSKRGRQSKSIWPFIRPHVYFIALSVLALFWGWGRVIFGISTDFYKPILASCWTVFHMTLAFACIRRSMWPEDKRYSYRHTVNLPVEFEIAGAIPGTSAELGCTIDLSEGGAAIIVYREFPVESLLHLRIAGTDELLQVDASVRWTTKLSRGRTSPEDGAAYRLGLRFEGITPQQFDVLNRIIMHYAVPRLYEKYYAHKRNLFERVWATFRRGPVRRRSSPREPYRLPFQFTSDSIMGQAVTEDVSREAAIAMLADPLPPGSRCDFTMALPTGPITGQADVIRHEQRIYANRTYYRTVFGYVHFEGQGRVEYDDLLTPHEKRIHKEALTPQKKPLSVPMGKHTLLASAALIPFVLILAYTFQVLHRDDMFLRDLIVSNGPTTAEEYSKLERIYGATLQERHPSTDRLVLLVSALAKAGRDADMNQVIDILASRDRKNLDLQIARANGFLNSRNYSRAREEYERLFREFQEGTLPPERKREMLIALARSTFHSGDVVEADRLFRDLIQAYPDDRALRYEYAGAMVSVHKYAEAMRAYDGMTPDRDGRLLLATAAMLANKPEEAERQCDLVLRASPNDADAQLLKADILNARQSTVQAEAIYQRLRRINPGDPAIRSRIAFIALSGKNYDQALAIFQQLYDEASTRPADVKGLVDAMAGATALGESHRELAMRVSKVALADWQDDATYLSRLAWVLQRVKEYEKSLELMQWAIEREPNNVDITRQYVGALFESGDHDRALPYLEKAEKTPENRTLLATIYLEHGRFAMAEAECKAVLKERPDDLPAQQLLAGCFSAQGKHKEALALLRALAADRPNDPQIIVWMAEALLASGDYPGAMDRLRTMLDTSFEQPRLWEHYANAASGLRQLPIEHLAMLRRIAERGAAGGIPKPEILSRLSWVLILNNDKTLVPRLLTLAVALKPKDPAQRVEIAGVLALAGRYRDALAMYEGVPLELQDPARLIALHSALKEWEPAEKLCWATLKKNPNDRVTWRWLADVLSWKGDYERSLEWFAKLLKEKPDDRDIQTRIAEVTLWRREVASALKQFEGLLAGTFEDDRLWSGFLAAAAQNKSLTPSQIRLIERIHERLRTMDAVSRKLRDDAMFLARLADGLIKAGQKTEAEALFKWALDAAPIEQADRLELADVLVSAGRFKDAINLFEGFPLDRNARLRLINIHAADGDFAKAKLQAQAVLEEAPDDINALRLLADVLSWNREYAEALKIYDALIRREPGNIDHRVRQAEITLWSREFAKALALFLALPERTQEVAAVRRGTIDAAAGAVKPLTPVEMKQLRTLANRCLTADDEIHGDAVALARLGGVLARNGDREWAARALERAIALDPKEPAIRLELGGALQSAERFDDALKIYDTTVLDGDARFRRIEVLAALKKFDIARDSIVTILRAEPESRVARRWLADVLSWKGEHAAAIRHFNDLLRETPDDADIAVRLAETTLWSGDAGRAARLFQALPPKALEASRVRRSFIDAVAGCDADAVPLIQPEPLLRASELALQPRDDLHTDTTHLSRLALSLLRANRKADAGQVLDQALAVAPRDPAVRAELGGVLVAAGRHADAFKLYDGLKLEGPYRFRLIELHTARGEWDKAMRELRLILERDTADMDARRMLADILSWQKQYPQAIELLDEVLRARPDDAETQMRLAEVLLWSGEYAKALARFQKLPEVMRERPAVRRGFIDAAAGIPPTEANRIDRAIAKQVGERTLRDGDPLLNDAVLLGRLGLVLARVDEQALAVRALDLAEKNLPATGTNRLELAGIMVAAGQYARAAKLYEGLNLKGENRFRLVELHAAQKDWVNALAECKRLLTLDAADMRALRWQADITSWQGDHADAIALFRKLIETRADDLDLKIRLAEVTLWSKDYPATVTALIALPDAALSRPEVRRAYIDAASAIDKPLDAAAIARARQIALLTFDAAADDMVRANVLSLSRLAWILLRGSDAETANKLLTLAIALKPTDPAGRKELGGVLAAAMRVPEAFAMYEGLTFTGDDRFRLIGLHSAARDFVKAEEETRKILRAEPENRKAVRWLADVLSWKGDFEESLRLFRDLLMQDPANEELKVRIAETTLWSKDGKAALPLYEALLLKEFDRPRLWEGFVAAAAMVPTLSDDQKTLVKRIRTGAERADLRSAVFWSRLAYVVFREGDELAGRQYMEKALALKPTEAIERKELAGVLSSFKRYKEAASLYSDFVLDRDDRLRLAELHAAAEDFPAAIRVLEALTRDFPTDRPALRYFADVLSWHKQYAASLELFDRLLKDEPGDAELQLRQAEVRLWSRANDAALATFVNLLNAGSMEPRVWSGFVDAAAGAKKVDALAGKAAVGLVRALDGNAKAKPLTDDPLFLGRLALVLQRGGQGALTPPLVARIMKKLPDSAMGRRELAGIFITLGANAQAREMYASIDRSVEDQLRLIDIDTAEKRFAEAEKLARDLHASNPNDVAVARKLASVLSAVEKHAEALVILLGIEKLNTDDRELPIDIALTALWAGRYDDALRRITPLLKSDPTPALIDAYLDAAAMVKAINPALHKEAAAGIYDKLAELKLSTNKTRQLAWVLRRVGEKQKAVALLTPLVNSGNGSREARLELAQTLDDLGKPDEAARHYRWLLNNP